MNCTRSKTGLPVISESGGSTTNTGSSQIVCGCDGEKIKPLFVPKGYSNGEHALFVAKEGLHIVYAGHSKEGEWVEIYKIKEIGILGISNEVVLELVYGYENGDGNIPESFNEATKAALEKSKDYHCRSAYYIKN